MLIISAGIQKSGSGYFYNIINALLVESGKGVDARSLKEDKNLDTIMQWHNNNIGKLTFLKLIRLWIISIKHGTFVVKTHEGPNKSAGLLNTLGFVRIVYSYRDPRDVLLSVIDHGNKILDQGDNHTFAKILDFDKAIDSIHGWLRIWKCYNDMTGALTIKYEDMMEDTTAGIKILEEFLDISIDSKQRKNILWKFSKDNSNGYRKGMHFNKAIPFRYKTEMSKEEKDKCSDSFREYIKLMNYAIE